MGIPKLRIVLPILNERQQVNDAEGVPLKEQCAYEARNTKFPLQCLTDLLCM